MGCLGKGGDVAHSGMQRVPVSVNVSVSVGSVGVSVVVSVQRIERQSDVPRVLSLRARTRSIYARRGRGRLLSQFRPQSHWSVYRGRRATGSGSTAPARREQRDDVAVVGVAIPIPGRGRRFPVPVPVPLPFPVLGFVRVPAYAFGGWHGHF